MGWTGKRISPPPYNGDPKPRYCPNHKPQDARHISGVDAQKNRQQATYHGASNDQRGRASGTTGCRTASYGPHSQQQIVCQMHYDQLEKGNSSPMYRQNTDNAYHVPIPAFSATHQNGYPQPWFAQQQNRTFFDGGYFVPSLMPIPTMGAPFRQPYYLMHSNFHGQYQQPPDLLIAAHQSPLLSQHENSFHSVSREVSSSCVENGIKTSCFPSVQKTDVDAQVDNGIVLERKGSFQNGICHDLSNRYINNNGSNKALSSQTNVLKIDKEVIKDAISYAESVYPNLGKQLYCVPSMDRSRHPDKASRLLVTQMESEKRVLGSFKQYFTSKNLPVVMLCYYPINGFLYYQLDDPLLEKGKQVTSQKSSRPGVVTLILLSSIFPVTIVTVNTVNGNSDFTFIQRTLQKAATHSKQCVNSVQQWLSMLNVNNRVKEIIAFPNLKKSIMQRVLANNRSFSEMSTLLMDDVSAPFEEEWSTPAHKLIFTDWMESHVRTMETGLTLEELQKVVGSMCCPQISRFESGLIDEEIDSSENIYKSNASSPPMAQDVGQLRLTIDGVTKGFDEYMEEYVSCYFPNLDTETYRVPPIHFNIQAQEKLNENIFFSNDESCTSKKSTSDEPSSRRHPPFMPLCKTQVYTACKNHSSKDDCISSPQMRSKKKESDELVDSRRAECRSYECFGMMTQVDENTKSRLKMAMEDVNVLSETMTKDVRADEGESRVMKAIESLGKRHGPMFIICSYQYNNYLNKLREEMFFKAETNRPVRAFGQRMRAQHDCLIFHKKYGAIIVCIKAIGDNFKEWGATEEDKINSTINIVKKALKQLDREESMVRHVTSDLSGPIKCHKLIALPNMLRADVARALSRVPDVLKNINMINGDLGVDAFLCQDELPFRSPSFWNSDDDPLSRWWQNICTKMMGRNEMSSQIYHQIIGRYCGLLSTVEVWTQTTPRVEVRSTSEAASECSQRFSKILLLPDQTGILQMDRPRVYLYGAPGTGKTMLLTLKAREWLCKGFKVIWINVRCGYKGYPFAYGVESRLRAMLHKLNLPQKNLQKIDIDSMKFESKLLANVLPSYRVIIDEVTPSSQNMVEHLCNLHLDRIWCASIKKENCPITAKGFESFQLKKILRSPPTVQNLMKELELMLQSSPSTSEEESEREISKLTTLYEKDSVTTLEIEVKKNPRIPYVRRGKNGSDERCKEKVDFPLSINLESYALATDGPKPIVIDHQAHGLPMDCEKCGQELAKHLHSLFHTSKHSSPLKELAPKNQLNGKNTGLHSPSKEYKTGKNYGKYNKNGNKLKWSDGLVVAKEVNKNCRMVKQLKKHAINIEVVTESAANHRLEDPTENKLFFTMCHEATGLERSVVVFVATLSPNQTEEERDKLKKRNQIDLRLQSCLARFHEDDQRALWHMASRTLSTLILVLP